MDKRASQAALVPGSGSTSLLPTLRKQACNIAGSPRFRERWERVEQLARTVPMMPLLLRLAVDGPFSQAYGRLDPAFQFLEQTTLMEAIELEATHPRYLPLPAVLADFGPHPVFQGARPCGRCRYREEMSYLDEETGQVLVDPLWWDQQEVYDAVNGIICPKDRRAVAFLSLPWRVGWCVGWLSGLAVAQPGEAHNGMVFLAVLVAPLMMNDPSLLAVAAPVGNRQARRAAARKKSLPAPRKQGKGC